MIYKEKKYMKGNDYSNSVRQIQQSLRIISKNEEKIPEVFVDGIFGNETAAAVKAYQKDRGFEPNGIVDNETWDSLNESANKHSANTDHPFPIVPFIDTVSIAKAGERRRSVYFVQLMFREISKKYCGFDDIELDGINDGTTLESIKTVQRCADIDNEDGTLDKATWDIIAQLFELTI